MQTSDYPSSYFPCPVSKNEQHKRKHTHTCTETEDSLREIVPHVCWEVLDKTAHETEKQAQRYVCGVGEGGGIQIKKKRHENITEMKTLGRNMWNKYS